MYSRDCNYAKAHDGHMHVNAFVKMLSVLVASAAPVQE